MESGVVACVDVDSLMEKSWETGKDAVDATQLLTLLQSKNACVTSQGFSSEIYSVLV